MASSTQARTPGRVVSFGEAMIRLTPPRNERLDRTISLDVTIGGAELNVAVALACLECSGLVRDNASRYWHRPQHPSAGARQQCRHARCCRSCRNRPVARAPTFSKKPPTRARPPSSTIAPIRPSPSCSPARSTGRRFSMVRRRSTSAASPRRLAPVPKRKPSPP